jgi:hypothetical protein
MAHAYDKFPTRALETTPVSELDQLRARAAQADAEADNLRSVLADVLTLVGEPLRTTLSQVLAVSEASLARRDRAPQETAQDMALIQRHAQSMLWRVNGALSGAGELPGGWPGPVPMR